MYGSDQQPVCYSGKGNNGMNNVRAVAERVIANVEKVIIGKHDAVSCLCFVGDIFSSRMCLALGRPCWPSAWRSL